VLLIYAICGFLASELDRKDSYKVEVFSYAPENAKAQVIFNSGLGVAVLKRS